MTTASAIESQYAFEIEYVDENDVLLARRRLAPVDFSHAVRHAKFDAFRRGLTGEYVPSTDGAHIEPVFPNDQGVSPRTKGFTVTVPLFGKGADLFGRKPAYLIGVGLFLGGSLLCATASTMEQLVLWRAVQGIGAGGVTPVTLTIVGDL